MHSADSVALAAAPWALRHTPGR